MRHTHAVAERDRIERGRRYERLSSSPVKPGDGLCRRAALWGSFGADPGRYDPVMALIDCPECGHEVSSSAVSCPNCGHPLGIEGADLVRELQRQQGAAEKAPAAAGDDRRAKQKVWSWVTIVAGAGLILGSLLPWATVTAPIVGTVNFTATDGDGMFTLIIGFVVGLMGVLGLVRGVATPGLVVLALAVVFAGLIAVTDLANVAEMATEINDENFGAASVGIGLWLVTVSTVVGAVGWVGLIFNRR